VRADEKLTAFLELESAILRTKHGAETVKIKLDKFSLCG
jgi:hypothetical protein